MGVGVDQAGEDGAAGYVDGLGALRDLARHDEVPAEHDGRARHHLQPEPRFRARSGELLGWRGRISSAQEELFWPFLLENIALGRCTPFLGPRVNAGLLPSTETVAEKLADKYGYPLGDCRSLVRVAQFIAVGLYYVILTGWRGETLGKMTLGSRVVGAKTGVIPTWRASTIRWAVVGIAGILPVPFLSVVVYGVVALDPRRRGLHDFGAGTVVVDVRRYRDTQVAVEPEGT